MNIYLTISIQQNKYSIHYIFYMYQSVNSLNEWMNWETKLINNVNIQNKCLTQFFIRWLNELTVNDIG